MKGLFLVGTDTGVGKTTLACGLLHLARLRDLPLVPFKPVETGCDPEPQDTHRLIAASGHPHLTPQDVCPYPLKLPVAPSVAARLEHRTVDAQHLLSRAQGLAARGASVLVEGAGGLLTPYGSGLTAATLASLFDIDVLLVAANRLGTINHSALALAEIQRRQLRCAGIVLVDVDPRPDPSRPTNQGEITDTTGVQPLGTLRFLPNPTPSRIADAAVEDLDLSTLFDGRLLQ